MAIGSKVSGDFKSATGLFAKVNGGWQKAKFGYVKVDGVWKQFWANKLLDTFSRTDTTSGLGTSESGQAWTIARSTWRINSNNATTAGSKTDYPLAYVDLGFYNGNFQANELAPGMGVAFRVKDANNWYAVVPYYNQTATNYSYCAAYGTPYQACTCSTYAQTGTYCSGDEVGTTYEGCYDTIPAGSRLEVVCGQPCGMVNHPITTVENRCTTTCKTQCQTCTSKQTAVPGTGLYLGSLFIPVRYTTTTTCVNNGTCCQSQTTCKDVTVTTNNYVYECTCTEVSVPFDSYCRPGAEYSYVAAPYTCIGTIYPTYGYTCPCGNYTTITPCASVATGTTYTNYYYIRVIQMVDGVASVISDTQVDSRFSAITATINAATLSVTAYSDSLYTAQVGTVSIPATFSNEYTGYGVIATQSNFEDGRTIGAIQVTAIGQ